jgi:hypothetical protein
VASAEFRLALPLMPRAEARGASLYRCCSGAISLECVELESD